MKKIDIKKQNFIENSPILLVKSLKLPLQKYNFPQNLNVTTKILTKWKLKKCQRNIKNDFLNTDYENSFKKRYKSPQLLRPIKLRGKKFFSNQPSPRGIFKPISDTQKLKITKDIKDLLIVPENNCKINITTLPFCNHALRKAENYYTKLISRTNYTYSKVNKTQENKKSNIKKCASQLDFSNQTNENE